jgi:YggT family protein
MTTVIYSVITLIRQLIWIYSIIMVIDAIMSWIPAMRNSTVGQLIDHLIEPYLSIFRKGPIESLSSSTGLDLSFILGLLLLYFIQDHVIIWIANILLRLVN